MQLTPEGPGFRLALVRLPRQMRRALRTFRKITGLTAVTSVATSLPESGTQSALSPPIHPRCAQRLRSVHTAPCKKQWLVHLRSSRRSADAISHACPIGLRCSCVPIRFDNHLVGVAKLVVDSEASDSAFSAATDVLKLVVSKTSEQSLVSVLSGQVAALQQRMSGLDRVHLSIASGSAGSERSSAEAAPGIAANENGTVVDRALAYLNDHHQEPTLSLAEVAAALGCNPTYLTTRFTRLVGERMHAHLVRLRVEHACRLLIGNGMPIKETAWASGFKGPTQMARSFRLHVGVSPREYRRIFASS